ncbi:hypothetical protein FRC18_005385 [Serendipita sp. 400]|nr:hypothetical protein FRC18_005385 [Serendipita sp. 400]
MHLSIASAVLFFLTVVAPVLTAPVPSPLSETTGIIAKRTLPIHVDPLHLAGQVAENVVPLLIPGGAGVRAAGVVGKLAAHELREHGPELLKHGHELADNLLHHRHQPTQDQQPLHGSPVNEVSSGPPSL